MRADTFGLPDPFGSEQIRYFSGIVIVVARPAIPRLSFLIASMSSRIAILCSNELMAIVVTSGSRSQSYADLVPGVSSGLPERLDHFKCYCKLPHYRMK